MSQPWPGSKISVAAPFIVDVVGVRVIVPAPEFRSVTAQPATKLPPEPAWAMLYACAAALEPVTKQFWLLFAMLSVVVVLATTHDVLV